MFLASGRLSWFQPNRYDGSAASAAAMAFTRSSGILPVSPVA